MHLYIYKYVVKWSNGHYKMLLNPHNIFEKQLFANENKTKNVTQV